VEKLLDDAQKMKAPSDQKSMMGIMSPVEISEVAHLLGGMSKAVSNIDDLKAKIAMYYDPKSKTNDLADVLIAQTMAILAKHGFSLDDNKNYTANNALAFFIYYVEGNFACKTYQRFDTKNIRDELAYYDLQGPNDLCGLWIGIEQIAVETPDFLEYLFPEKHVIMMNDGTMVLKEIVQVLISFILKRFKACMGYPVIEISRLLKLMQNAAKSAAVIVSCNEGWKDACSFKKGLKHGSIDDLAKNFYDLIGSGVIMEVFYVTKQKEKTKEKNFYAMDLFDEKVLLSSLIEAMQVKKKTRKDGGESSSGSPVKNTKGSRGMPKPNRKEKGTKKKHAEAKEKAEKAAKKAAKEKAAKAVEKAAEKAAKEAAENKDSGEESSEEESSEEESSGDEEDEYVSDSGEGTSETKAYYNPKEEDKAKKDGEVKKRESSEKSDDDDSTTPLPTPHPPSKKQRCRHAETDSGDPSPSDPGVAVKTVSQNQLDDSEAVAFLNNAEKAVGSD